MDSSLSPGDALSPEAFYSLYLGGLALEDERRRRDACYVLLLAGRLGIRPAELTHLHEDWIDWSRGEIHVPARDPCACAQCWERARLRRERGDERPIEEILKTALWTPPDGERAARAIPFGWSRRLTAALDGVLGDRQYLDTDRSAIEDLVHDAAENAWELEPDRVSLATLRATAGSFLANAGFGARRLADLLVVDEATAGEFARVGGGELREHLYRALDHAEPPEICGENSQYRLVCDPDPFEREPFDPRSYDARWRVQRSDRHEPRGYNPRPATAPPNSSFEPSDDLDLREPAADSGSQLVNASLRDWVRRRESQRRRYAETGSTALSPDGQDPEYRDWVTAPVRLSLSTRFAAQGVENGRPTGGSLVLGQRELVLLSRDETGIADTLRVPFPAVIDVVPGYTPGPLGGVFEETVGLAYRDDHGERNVVVCELPEGFGWDTQQTLFSSLLEDIEVVYENLSENVTVDAETDPETHRLTTTARTLKIEHPDSEALPTRIPLSTIVGIEERPMESEVDYEMGVTIHHLRVNANVATAELRATDDVKQQILKRYLLECHERQKQRAENASLSEEQYEVLDALHDAGPGRDLVAILDMNPSRVSSIVASLKDLGLVRDSRTGIALTGTGYLITSGGSLLYDATDQ